MSAQHGNPLIERVDALLRRHRGGDAAAAPPPADPDRVEARPLARAQEDARGGGAGEPGEAGEEASTAPRPEVSVPLPEGEEDVPVLTEVVADEAPCPSAEARRGALADALERALIARLGPRLEEAVREAVREAVAKGLVAAGEERR